MLHTRDMQCEIHVHFHHTFVTLDKDISRTPRSNSNTQQAVKSLALCFHNRAISTDSPLCNAPHPDPPALVTNRETLTTIGTHRRAIAFAIAIRPRTYIAIIAVIALRRFVLLRILVAGCRVRRQEWKALYAICDCAGSGVNPRCGCSGRIGAAVVVTGVPLCC